MKRSMWILLVNLAHVLAASTDTSSHKLKPHEEKKDVSLTTLRLRSLPMVQSQSPNFGDNFGYGGLGGPYGSSFSGSDSGSGANQQFQGLNGQVQLPLGGQMPLGPTIVPFTPMAQFGQGGISPMRFGQPIGYPWMQQGYPGQPPLNQGYFQNWLGMNRPLQLNPYAQQLQQLQLQQGAYPALQQLQFGQQPVSPVPNPYFNNMPFNPYQPLVSMPPPPQSPYFQGGPPQPMDVDDRYDSERRNQAESFGSQIGQNPPMSFSQPASRGLPLLPMPPAFPGGAMNGNSVFNGGKGKRFVMIA